MLPGVLIAGGCFHYVPMTEPPPRATRIRITLAEPADVPLGRLTIHDAARVTGELIAVRDDSIVVSALSVADTRGIEYGGDGMTVGFVLADAAAIDVRRFSAWRTAGAAGMTIGLAILGSSIATGGGGGTTGGGPPGQSK